ncbi:hypothetical protein [Mesorhizobium sp. M0011]|uniref:hypothetical protein n=1 Tax=Mesorhizobium sp. M0011 TaxID=2956839 RepID=UPI003336A2A2
MVTTDRPRLILRLDPFLSWLESCMLHREPQIQVTEQAVTYFQALMRGARAYGYVPGSGRAELLQHVSDGFISRGKPASCHYGLNWLLVDVFGELLLEDEPHIELHEFCRFLVAALELKINVKDLGKKGVRFQSCVEFDGAEGVAIDLTIPNKLREPIDPVY